MRKTLAEIEALAGAWLRYHEWFVRGDVDPPVPHPDQGGNDEVLELMRLGDEDGWRVLVELVRQAPDDILASIGAGPFEEWISDDSAMRHAPQIQQELRENRRFRAMVRSAWELPAVVNQMIAAIKWED